MATLEISRTVLQAQHVAVVRGQTELAGIAAFLTTAFGEVLEAALAQGRQVTGPPFASYQKGSTGGWDVTAGFPVDAPLSAVGRVRPDVLPGGAVAYALHRGSYEGVSAAYEALLASVVENGDRVSGVPWECYLDGPEVAEPRTEVFVPYERAQRH